MKITKENLVESFSRKNAIRFEMHLKELLNREAYYPTIWGETEDLLAEYRNNFDWEEEYAVTYKWEFVSNYGEKSIDYSSREEMMEYCLGYKQVEEPESFDEIHYSEECSGHYRTFPSVWVKNLRLKQSIPATV